MASLVQCFDLQRRAIGQCCQALAKRTAICFPVFRRVVLSRDLAKIKSDGLANQVIPFI